MKQGNKKTGDLGEVLAVEFLRKEGYEIVERNFRTRFGEIDIIGKKDGVVVFVEVKTKVGDDFGAPEEMINKRKINQIKKMAAVFLEGEEVRCRLDMVAIVFSEDMRVLRLTHYENIT